MFDLKKNKVGKAREIKRKNEPIIAIKDLKVVYNLGKLNETMVLRDITLNIKRGEYITFFGPSGCGKSTLLNVIAGLQNPTNGKTVVDRQDLSLLSADEMAIFHRKKLGMIFQAYNLIPTLDVLDNVALPQVFEKVKRSKRRENSRNLLEKMGIGEMEKRLPQELSGGQQQRVGIARSLVNNPPIILADEAVGNLDSESAKNVLEILDKLNKEDGKTIIAVTHNPENLHYADRVFYMKDGLIVKEEVVERKERVNEAKIRPEFKRERNELDLLLQTYPDLSAMQMHVMLAPFKAKILVNYLISRFENQEIKVLEGLVTNRLLDQISSVELMNCLKSPLGKNGTQMSSVMAEKFHATIEDVVSKAEFIKSRDSLIKDNKQTPIQEAVSKLRTTLLDGYRGELSFDQVEALNKGIEFRLLGKINRKETREFFDRPLKKGGVGLNRKTAKRMSAKLEMVLLVEFGK